MQGRAGRSRNDPPPLSIVIPCYNQARWVGEAIDSIDYGNVEIIVVDDGSSDNIEDAVVGRPHALLLKQSNQGVSVARNVGFHNSRGGYVVFLDADDRLVPTWLNEAINFLETHHACAFVYGHIKLISAEGHALGTPIQPPVWKEHYRSLLARNYIWTPGCVVYRRAALESIGGFDPAFRGPEDFDLNLRIARQFPIQCLNRLALEYRTHGTGLSSNLASMMVGCLAVLRLQVPYVLGKHDLEMALKQGVQSVRDGYGEDLISQCFQDWRKGNWRRASRNLLILVRYHPRGVFRRIAHWLSVVLVR